MVAQIQWYVSLGLGFILFISGIFLFIFNRQKREMAFAKMSVMEILAAWFLIFPAVLSGEPGFSLFVYLKSILLTCLNVLLIFSGNGYYEVEIAGSQWFGNLYSVVLSLVNLCVMISLIGFVVEFLGDFFENILFDLKKYKKIYLFSELNEKTLFIARSVTESNHFLKKKEVIVFAGEDYSSSQKNPGKKTGAFFTDMSFERSVKKMLKNAETVDIFIFGESESDNLTKLNEFSEIKIRPSMANSRVYVELSDTPWDIYGDFVDSNGLSKDKVIVNLLNTDENFILNDLFQHSVFENSFYDEEKGRDIVEALVVGASNKSIEMVKTLLYLCQMPGYELHLTVLDAGEGREAFRQIAPEIREFADEEGESIYTFRYIENVNFSTLEFEENVTKNCPQFTFAFVDVKEEKTNINLALRLDKLRYRMSGKMDYKIQVCSGNNQIMNNWTEEVRKNILLVGGNKSLYDYDFITMSKIEKASKAIHEIRQKDKRKAAEEKGVDYKEAPWTDYNNDAYKRMSVYARTLSLKYKLETLRKKGLDISVIKTDGIWKMYEHMRWNMYTRSRGYIIDTSVNADIGTLTKEQKLIAKIHNDLVPFEMLPESEQKKDSIDLTEDIVRVFDEMD